MNSSTDYYHTVYPTPTYTVVYTTHDGRTIYKRNVPIKTVDWFEESELEAGDTSAIDSFLGGFSNAKE